MAAFFGNLRNVVIASFVLAILLVGIYCATQGFDGLLFELFVLRWLHIAASVMWIGLLWYFNFVQIPTMPKVPDELKKGVTGYIAPKVFFYFRWAALLTVVTGLLIAILAGYGHRAMTFAGATRNENMIGLGMWLALIMAFNVWFIIWPAQKKILGLAEATDEEKAKLAPRALMASRTNLLLSLPMLYCMASANLS